MKTAAIINPKAGQGRCLRRWERQQRALRDVVGPMKYCPTEGPGHGKELVHDLLHAGYEHIISAGGDGTHFEVVNGWFDDGKVINPSARMTVLPMGTGSDLARSLGVAPGLPGIASLRDARTIQADVGCVTCNTTLSGDPKRIYFLNLAHVGLGATVCRYVNGHSKALGGFLSYLRAILLTLTWYESRRVSITMDGHLRRDEPTLDFSIAKGSYDAGGLLMAPHARLDNGIFDCYHIRPLGFFDALGSLPKLYTGRLSERRDVVTYLRGKTIEIRSEEPVDIEVDGEFIGYLPATISLIPGALQLTEARRESS